MTRASPESSRKHPRCIILKVSQISSKQKDYMRAHTRTRLGTEGKKKNNSKITQQNKISALMDAYSDPGPGGTGGEADFRVCWWQKRQILKVKSRLRFKDPISRYCQRGNFDDMFPLLLSQAVWTHTPEWANFKMCFSAHWELVALACSVCVIYNVV